MKGCRLEWMLWWRQEAPAQWKMFLRCCFHPASIAAQPCSPACPSGKCRLLLGCAAQENPIKIPRHHWICAMQKASQLGKKCCPRAQTCSTGWRWLHPGQGLSPSACAPSPGWAPLCLWRVKLAARGAWAAPPADGPVTCLFLVGRTALETPPENTTVSHIRLSSCP